MSARTNTERIAEFEAEAAPVDALITGWQYTGQNAGAPGFVGHVYRQGARYAVLCQVEGMAPHLDATPTSASDAYRVLQSFCLKQARRIAERQPFDMLANGEVFDAMDHTVRCTPEQCDCDVQS